MIYLLLAILSSTVIALGMRLSTGRVKAPLAMLAANYLVCTLLGAVYAGFSLPVEGEGLGLTAALAAVTGVLLLSGFLLFRRSVAASGMVLSTLFMKLGLLVPFLLSVFLFRESPTAVQIVGFCAAVVAILLFNWEKGEGKGRLGWEPILLLLACGGADAMMKVFEAVGPAPLSDLFLCMSFGVAFLLCALLVTAKKERPDRGALLFGGAIGVANFFSSKLLLAALTPLPAVVVFPTFSVGAMLLVTACGILFFRERLARRQWPAFAIFLAALVLLNI